MLNTHDENCPFCLCALSPGGGEEESRPDARPVRSPCDSCNFYLHLSCLANDQKVWRGPAEAAGGA